MVSVKKLEMQIEEANAIGRQNLTDKGVEVEETATTYEIMSRIAELSGGGNIQTIVEYIESTGTQYINTECIASNKKKVVIDCEITCPSGLTMPFGSFESGKYFAWYTNGARLYAFYISPSQNTSAPTGRTVLVADGNKWSFDDTTLEFADTTFTGTIPMYLFSVNQGGDSPNAIMKVYSCQIYDNGTLVRDFVPCTNANGTVGLYDFVNDVFYANAGTGVFTAGAEVELPPVEILDDYTWYHSDIPQANELNAYLKNVKWLRDAMVLYPNTPEVPADMQGFTFAEANDIEKILANIETIINLMVASFIYSGEIFSEEVI